MNNEPMSKEILNAVLAIAKQDQGDILFLFSQESFGVYPDSKYPLSGYFKNNMTMKQRFSGWDTSNGVVDVMRYIANVFVDVQRYWDREFVYVCTKSRDELDELAKLVLNSDLKINIYIL